MTFVLAEFVLVSVVSYTSARKRKTPNVIFNGSNVLGTQRTDPISEKPENSVAAVREK